MKIYYRILFGVFIGTIGAMFASFAVASEQTNPYAAGYQACSSKYKDGAGADNTEYTNCLAKAKCVVDNPGETEYCDCIGNGGIKLNTNVPFIGRCINKDNSTATGSTTSTAFGDLIGGLSKMVVTAILIVSFMMIIIGGVMRTSGNPKGGKALITKVVIGLAILGASGAILRLINPNFFK